MAAESVMSTRLGSSRIAALPDAMYYIPNFITSEEEAHIIPENRWITLSHRRLQAHPSTLSKSNTLLDSPLPAWLSDPILSRFKDLGLWEDSPHNAPNHVLLNEYKPGEGIMPHEDGGAYWPIVATVSLNASLVLDVYDKRKEEDASSAQASSAKPNYRILQEPRSLLITTGSAYKDLMHGIAEVEVDEDLNAETVANWDLLGDGDVFVKQGVGISGIQGPA
ncbi:hypothetical protein H2203_007751 [Taxawa tesnikishii (nom. ined.)]|nr:hypothetical protein H2203_007751 [Dothideales sp. JES 119]